MCFVGQVTLDCCYLSLSQVAMWRLYLYSKNFFSDATAWGQCVLGSIHWETFFGRHIILIHSLMKVYYLSQPKNFEIWGKIYETFDTQSRNTSDLWCFDEGSQREGMLHFKRSQTYIILCYLFIRNSQDMEMVVMEEADKVAGKVADEVARNPGWQNSTRVAEILQFKNRRVSCTCVVAPTNAFLQIKYTFVGETRRTALKKYILQILNFDRK